MRTCLLIILSVCLCGCATSIDTYLKSHPETSSNSRDCMVQQKLCLGMTTEEVEATFGQPTDNHFDSIEGDNLFAYILSTPDSVTGMSFPERYYLRFVDNALTRIETQEEEIERDRQERVGQYIQEHSDRVDVKQLMLDKKIKIGMTKEEVKLSWGEPNNVNRTIATNENSEQWVYGSLGESSKMNYLYFEDAVLASWQDSQ